MSGAPKSRVVQALVGVLVAAVAGFGFWALFGRDAEPKAPAAEKETKGKPDGARKGKAKRTKRAKRRPPGELGARTDRPPVPQGRFEGEVVAVLDGDTIDVMHDGAAVRVRLAGVDCPERRQAWGQKAKERTSELVFGKRVSVNTEKADRFGRALASVTQPDGNILNETLLREGLAWWYRRYSDDRRLEALETEARNAKVGLWSDPNPTAPWEMRHRPRGKRPGGQGGPGGQRPGGQRPGGGRPPGGGGGFGPEGAQYPR
jgi:endonuclease YncB( thermonuclease family)